MTYKEDFWAIYKEGIKLMPGTLRLSKHGTIQSFIKDRFDTWDVAVKAGYQVVKCTVSYSVEKEKK